MEQGPKAAAFVTQMVVTTAVGGWLGHHLDGRLDTDPWLMVTGFILGFTLGMLALFRVLTQADRESDDDEPPDLP